MSDQLGPSHSQALFEAALRDYEKQTGITLAKHPLAEQLQNCNSVESITAVFTEQTQAFTEFRGKDKVLKPLKKAVSVLYKLSAAADFGQGLGLVFPPVTAIHTGLAVLFSTVQGVIDSYDTLIDLLESIEHFLGRLGIYTKIPPTQAMTEMVVKILVELLSTLALVTKQIKQGRSKKFVKKLLGENDVEAVLQRLDRLTQDEARITAAQTLEVVYGLVQNMKVVMDDGVASVDCVKDALETMQQVAGDVNKLKRDELEQRVQKWLSAPDPWKNHNIACKSSHRGSAEWFVQGDTFSEWKASEVRGSLLWVHGKPGAGKSVLCSTIIEDVDAMRKTGLASLVFFYCDFREDQKKDLRGLLSSLLIQLCHQSDSYCDMLFKFYSDHGNGSRHPSDDALAGYLKNLLKLPGQAPVFLIVDALDECPCTSAVPSPREEVLNLIEELIKSEIPNLRICVTSRPETDIKDVLDPLIFRSISLHDENGQKKDIEDYIKSVINTHPKNRRWKADHKQLVIDVLTEKADGMFRWVYCQVVYICGCIPARIQQALADLPETLDETYERTLREINKVDWEFAHRMFQFVSVASRPLRVDELADLLAFDFKAGPIPEFHEDWLLEDPVDAVLTTCSTLLAIVYGGERIGNVIQFSHFSVKEYLTSARLAESSDTITRRYHISTTPAHTLAAQACLGLLLHLDKDVVTRDGLEELRLAKYAAEHWADHVRLDDVSQIVEDGMKQLFDPSKPHLAVCIWIHDPDVPPWEGNPRTEKPVPTRNAPLYYATFWGLHSMVEFLVIEHLQDVHSRSFTDDATPLHLASEQGHVKVARFLLKCNVEVTTRNNDDVTPLHLASYKGRREIVDMLIERGADVGAQNKAGETPLHLASQQGELEVAGILIDHGADVTAQNKVGEAPLHLVSRDGQLAIARMLIERGADMAAQSKFGGTPLHLASREGRVEVAGLLIERGADVTNPTEDGTTPLLMASSNGNIEIVRMLIKHGADVTVQDENGWTPLHVGSCSGQVEITDILVERGADLNAQDDRGFTPLNLAVERNQMEVAGWLIERGADVNVQSKDGVTPLHLASQNGELEVTGMLIEHGADVTARNKDGSTPLHLLSSPPTWAQISPEQFAEIARLLLEHGADRTAKDKDGKTPVDLASSDGRLAEVVRVLLQHGAHPGTHDSHENVN